MKISEEILNFSEAATRGKFLNPRGYFRYYYGIRTLIVLLLLKYLNVNKGCPYTIVEGFGVGKQFRLYEAYVSKQQNVKHLFT